MTDQSDLLQSDLSELLTLLEMGDHARPRSPHEVMQEVIGVVRRRLQNLDDEAASLDGMAEASRRTYAKHIALGDEVTAAYWKGRARGLQLAAHNLHLSPEMPLNTEEAGEP